MSKFAQTLFIKDLKLDHQFQARSRLNEGVVKDYETVLAGGGVFPPIQIVKTTNELIVVDGFHRLQAFKSQGRDRIDAEVFEGDHSLALKMAIGANQTHGLRRSNEDKQRAVQMALDDFELAIASDRELADLCGVSPPLVASIRARLGKPKSQSKFARQTPNPGRVSEVKEFSPPHFQDDPGFDPAAELINTLTSENEQLRDRLAVSSMDANPQDRDMAAQTIAELREELRVAHIELEAVKRSRDAFQNENNQMRKQITMLEHKRKLLNDQLSQTKRIEESPPF